MYNLAACQSYTCGESGRCKPLDVSCVTSTAAAGEGHTCVVQCGGRHFKLSPQVGPAVDVGYQLLPEVSGHHMDMAPWPGSQLAQ